jgi:hypothetical protein
MIHDDFLLASLEPQQVSEKILIPNGLDLWEGRKVSILMTEALGAYLRCLIEVNSVLLCVGWRYIGWVFLCSLLSVAM